MAARSNANRQQDSDAGASGNRLHELEAQLRLELGTDNSKIGVWTRDIVNDQLHWCARMFELYGVEPEEFEDGYEVWRHRVHTDDAGRVHREIQLAEHGTRAFNSEFRIVRPDGEIRHIRALARAIHAKDGTPLHLIGVNLDITGHKEAERLIQESERRYAALLSNLPGMAYRCRNDHGWTMEFASEGCEALTGYTAGELTGKRPMACNDLIHPDDRELVWTGIQAALAERRHYELEYRIMHRDGTEKWVWERGSGRFSNQDGLLYLEGFVSDITARKQAELQLFERKEQLKTTLDSIGDAVISSNKAGLVAMMNPVAEALTGWTWKQAQGKPIGEVFRIIDEQTRETTHSPVDLVLASGDMAGLANHTLLIARDGREIPIADSGAPIRNSLGEITGAVLVFRDQTNERNARNALKKSEAQYRALFENMTAGFALHEMVYNAQGEPIDYRFLQANAAFEKKTGLKMENILGRTVRETMPSIEPFWIETYGKVALTGEPVEFENHAKELGRHYLVRAYSPAPNRFATVITDITERKNTERKLKEMTELQGMILDNSTLGIALVRQRNFEWVNPRLCEMAGIPDAELRGSSTRSFYLTEEMFERIGQRIYETLAEGRRFDDRIQFKRRNGTPFWCRVIGVAFDPSRADEGSLWMLEDISEQVESEARLLMLSTVIEQSPGSVLIADTQGHIQYVNPAFEKATGYSLEEALGKSTNILKSGEQDAAFYADLWNTIQAGNVWSGRLVNKRRNGSFFTENALVSPVRDAEGNIAHYVAIKRDISVETALEEELRQSQKMEAVGQLAGGVAHDFNNILQAILGFGQLLQVDMEKDSQEYDSAGEIIKAAKRAAKLTAQLLAFSRKQPAQQSRMDLNAAVRDTEALLHMLLGEKYNVVLELEEKLLPIRADHGQMTQIIMNLAVNARDAMPNPGRLTIATDNLVLDEKDLDAIPDAIPGNYVCLSVTDTGCGMDQTVKDRIFEPFFTTKDVGKGSGLGLSVVYGIVQQNKGWINVYSERHLGSNFRIYLPAETSNPPSQWEGLGNALAGKRILLVEDDEGVGNMAITTLENAGAEAVRVFSAEDALDLFAKNASRFDLLISDMVLPAMDGGKLADAVRDLHPSLPILLYSGYRDLRERWKHVVRKDYFFTHKPFTGAGLVSNVKDILTDKNN